MPSSSARRPMATVLAAGAVLLLAFGAALVTSVIGAAPASAHAAMVKITPAANEALTRTPTQVVVEFNEPMGTAFTTVLVTSADGASVARGKPAVSGGTVTQALKPGLPSGTYRIAYRVTSDDGHPVTGESRFTLTLTPTAGPESPGTPASTSSPSPVSPSLPGAATAPAEGSKPDQSSWLSTFIVPISGSVVLLVIGIGVLLWERRRR